MLGVAFGNILAGVDLNEQGDIHANLFDLLNPYALLIGVTGVSMFAMHGLLFLSMKTQGKLEARVRRFVPRAMLVFFVLTTASVIATAVFPDDVRDAFVSDIWPLIFQPPG